MLVKWSCKVCKDIVISNSHRRHEMDTCKCGCSGLDLEEDYARIMGDYQFIEEIDYDFFEELLLCFKEQDIPIPTKVSELFPYGPFISYDLSFIRKLEDKMVKQLK